MAEDAHVCPGCGTRAPSISLKRQQDRRKQVAGVAATLVLAALLIVGVDQFNNWQTNRAVEKDRDECRRELIAEGASPRDVTFDVAVAMCALNR